MTKYDVIHVLRSKVAKQEAQKVLPPNEKAICIGEKLCGIETKEVKFYSQMDQADCQWFFECLYPRIDRKQQQATPSMADNINQTDRNAFNRVDVKPGTKATHKVPSGMGGVFDVIIDVDAPERDDMKKVVVINRQSDFHGYTFYEPVRNIKTL